MEISDRILALSIYLLDLGIRYSNLEVTSNDDPKSQNEFNDLSFTEWFTSSSLLTNFSVSIENVKLNERASFEGAVEEMEIDEQYDGSDEYMSSDDEGQPYQVHSPPASETGEGRSLEAAPPRPQLPSINVPLALPSTSPTTTFVTSNSMAIVPAIERQIVPVEQVSPNNQTQMLPPPSQPRPIQMAEPNSTHGIVVPSIHRRGSRRLRGSRPCDQRTLLLSQRRFGRYYQTEKQSSADSISDTQSQLVVKELIKALPPSLSMMTVNESILSLLLRLHSKMASKPDSYKPCKGRIDESRIGDGLFFIEQLLDRFVMLNQKGEQLINDLRKVIWPKEASEERKLANEEAEKEERKKRAKERQEKLMAEFASKQKAFLKNMEAEAAAASASEEPTSTNDSSIFQLKEYQCVICNQTGPSTNEKLFGQVVLLQSTSVLGHAYIGDFSQHKLPISDEEVQSLNQTLTLAKFMEQRIDEFDQNFDQSSWLNSLNIGWTGGVHVQSCGHYLHIDCQKSYIQSLRGGQQNRFGTDQAEYLCPLCRQLANSVLPLNPKMNEIGALVKSRPNDIKAVSEELFSLLSNNSHQDSEYLRLLASLIEDLTKATGPQYRSIKTPLTEHSLFLFLSSILRTNLEVDLLIKRSKSIPCGAKKACFCMYQLN